MPRFGSDGPRDRHRLTGRDEWTTAVAQQRVEPIDLTDALAVAFTAALLDAMGDPETLSFNAGEDSGGHRRAAYEVLATELGMGRERLRLTLQGARWVTLPEISDALASPRIGPVLQRRLTESLQPEVLRKDRDSGREAGSEQGSGEGWVPAKPAAHRKEPDMDEIAQIESRIRADVVTLDRIIQAAARRGRTAPTTTDWAAIRRTLGTARAPRNTRPGDGMAARVRSAGVANLADLLRSHLHGGKTVQTYAVRAAVQRQYPQITADQIDAAFARLYRRGEVERLSRGVYRATALPKRPGG